MADKILLNRLKDAEDNFVERKPANPNREDLRRTIVAFANSVPKGRTGVLFVGVKDNGEIETVPNTDKLQKTIREVCERDCYPKINYSSEVLEPESGVRILAVEVPASADRPHFSGPAYVRRGSESVAASKEVFDELVYSRNSKYASLLEIRRTVVTVLSSRHFEGIAKDIPCECRFEELGPQTLRLRILRSDRYVTVPLDGVMEGYDDNAHRPKLYLWP